MARPVSAQDAVPSPRAYLIEGPIHHYAWGDTTFLPAFLNRAEDGRPWAEWWLGTHRNGPAHLPNGQLLEEISGPLPFLVKVLAAAQPLSLQIHPNAAQAASGYIEGRFGDPYPKPELIHALSDFEAFCGIRPISNTLAILNDHGLEDLAQLLRSTGVAGAMRAILTKEFHPASTIATCSRLTDAASGDPVHPAISWVAELAHIHPGDPSVVATLLLHHVRLRPGQALRLTAGTLHAYLRGVGLEVMGPSDNVVRCGLTAKPVDINGVLALLDPTEIADPVIGEGLLHDLPGTNIRLWQLPQGQKHIAATALIAVAANGHGYFIEAGAEFEIASSCYLIGT